jgi:2-hydroxy-6-oxonona-2,4-dienedioate hydrolase
MFQDLEMDVDGVTMRARRAGADGPGLADIVLVHGLGLSGRYMEPVARALRHRARVWLPDLPGFGESDKPAATLDVAALADALAGWIRAAGIGAPVLLANSFGCQIAIDLAARHPGLASALILQGPTTPPGERGWWRQFRTWRRNSPFNRLGMGEVSWSDYRKAGYGRVLGTFRAQLRDRPEDKLARIDIPALIVRGEFDPICHADWAAEIARGLRRGRLVEIPHVAHTLVWDAPGELALVSVDFIAERLRPSPLGAGKLR